MSWICNNCETENADHLKVCEVCNSPRMEKNVKKKNHARVWYLLFMLLTILLWTILGVFIYINRSQPSDQKASADSIPNNISSDEIIEDAIESDPIALPDKTDEKWLQVCYGMEKDDATGKYFDQALDTIGSIRKIEHEAYWPMPNLEMKYLASICLYIDNEFPSGAVFNRVNKYIGDEITKYVSYYYKDLPFKQLFISNITLDDIDESLDNLFETVSMEDVNDESETNADFRLCIVAHKIFESIQFVTYYLGTSYNLNGSNGAPYYAKYVTFDKYTGKALTWKNMFGNADKKDVCKKAWHNYKLQFDKINNDGYLECIPIEGFSQETNDNIAILYEGVLFYYVPYLIGSGSEGQYNCIINEKELWGLIKHDYWKNKFITGATPYYSAYGKNYSCPYTQCSGIKVTAPRESDIVVIIKRNNSNGEVIAHGYIRAGDNYQFDVPDGTYQTFFYYGEGWNPNKVMKEGVKGGFVKNEIFSKDNPQDIYSDVLSYVLQLQRDGNFQTKGSNKSECF